MCWKCLVMLVSVVGLDHPAKPAVRVQGMDADVAITQGKMFVWGHEVQPTGLHGRYDISTGQYDLTVTSAKVLPHGATQAQLTTNVSAFLATSARQAKLASLPIPAVDPHSQAFAEALKHWDALRQTGADSATMTNTIRQRVGSEVVVQASARMLSLRFPGDARRFQFRIPEPSPIPIDQVEQMTIQMQTIADALNDGDWVAISSEGFTLIVPRQNQSAFTSALNKLRAGRPIEEWRPNIPSPFEKELLKPKKLVAN